jgi:dihydropteroate synthase
MIFLARNLEFVFPRPAVVMGVVNITPDSFSDGGKFLAVDAAVAHALELEAQGAEILDIGGESTRPNAEPVSEEEEIRRVMPVIGKLAGKTKAALSIDTMKPGVARSALAAGACMVNDVAAHRNNAAMWKVVSEFRAGYICMHAQGSPQTMQKQPVYADVVREVGDFFREQLGKLNAEGIASDQIILDPGIGFGKSAEHNLRLLAGLRSFTGFGRPLLVGVSRKSFIEKLSGAKMNERLPGSLACATLAIADGVQFIRTHDVLETVQAIRMAEAVLSRKQNG